MGNLIINGKDAYKEWGVFLEDGAENILLLPSSNKEPISNKSRVKNGKEIIPTPNYVDERDFNITFCIKTSSKSEFLSKYKAFVAFLNKGLVSMQVKPLGETYKLTVKDYMSLDHLNGLGTLNVRFNEPNPADR